MSKVKTMVIGVVSIDSVITVKEREYCVRVRQTGDRHWYAAADYYTNDRIDAQCTQVAMMHNYREHIAQQKGI